MVGPRTRIRRRNCLRIYRSRRYCTFNTLEAIISQLTFSIEKFQTRYITRIFHRRGFEVYLTQHCIIVWKHSLVFFIVRKGRLTFNI